MSDDVEPAVWAVAGCLFEVSLPEDGDVPWQWRDPGPEVTLLGQAIRDGQRHFRFRAEAGATAGEVRLRFRPDGGGRRRGAGRGRGHRSRGGSRVTAA